MVFELMDYNDKRYSIPYEIDLDNIEEITITVISGDEIVDILFTNGDSINVDVCELNGNSRFIDYFDGTAIIYSKRRGINLLDKFLSRISSYTILDYIDYMWEPDDEEE